MKITRAQLQEYFAAPLPDAAAIADAFTFHCFEIESVEGDELDIKVLPNRAADCARPEGVARELSAILDLPLIKERREVGQGAPVTVSLASINGLLGSSFAAEEVEDVFRRLDFSYTKEGSTYSVSAPADRNDLVCMEDVAEEVGRILGYDRIPEVALPLAKEPIDQNRFHGIERMKDQLVEQGFTEVLTQSFARKGDVELANPLDSTRPYLRTSLAQNLEDALVSAKRYAPTMLPPGAAPKLFEVGTVFPKEGEYLELRMTETVPAWGENFPTTDNLSKAKLEEYGRDYAPKRSALSAYKPFSAYPFVTRDIACWVPVETAQGALERLIRSEAGKLLLRLDPFDRFEKSGRVSYAFRLVFQSFERTLTDEEVNAVMEKIAAALAQAGYEVR